MSYGPRLQDDAPPHDRPEKVVLGGVQSGFGVQFAEEGLKENTVAQVIFS